MKRVYSAWTVPTFGRARFVCDAVTLKPLTYCGGKCWKQVLPAGGYRMVRIKGGAK